MSELYGLDAEDIQILKRLIAANKGRLPDSRAIAPRLDVEQSTPEVYICKVLTGGIAARSGTTVSSAECDVHRIVNGTIEATGVKQVVYNLRTSALALDDMILVQRDKYGNWVVPSSVFTVEDIDGTPSYRDITKLQFDQADGFTITNPSTGVARIDLTNTGGIALDTIHGGYGPFTGVTELVFDDHKGWSFQNLGSGSIEIRRGQPFVLNLGNVASGYNITTTLGYIRMSITIPRDGKYIISVNAHLEGTLTAKPAGTGGYIYLRLYNNTAGAYVSPLYTGMAIETVTYKAVTSSYTTPPLDFLEGDVIELHGRLDTFATWSSAGIIYPAASDTYANSHSSMHAFLVV